MIVGKVQGHGFGNSLVPFPAAYYFAAFTGREILVYDNSPLGFICSMIVCGFRSTSSLSQNSSNWNDHVQSALDLNYIDFQNHMEEKINITSPFVADYSLTPKSDWWAWYPQARECVKKISGCIIGDIMCSERFALQTLIMGPLKRNLSIHELRRLESVQNLIVNQLNTTPRNMLPRFDVGIHLRSQLVSFEISPISNSSIAAMNYDTERLLNTSNTGLILHAIDGKLKHILSEVPKTKDFYYVYVASDNEQLKEMLVTLLSDNPIIKVMSLKTTRGILHVKNLKHQSVFDQNEGIFDLFLDWYLLSLSNSLIAWRKGNSLSSFAYSAQRISGDIARSDVRARSGIGTVGYLLGTDRRSRLKFDYFWSYPVVEDI